MKHVLAIVLLAILTLGAAWAGGAAAADITPTAGTAASSAQTTPFDVEAATNAYMAKLSPAARQTPMPISRVATGCSGGIC